MRLVRKRKDKYMGGGMSSPNDIGNWPGLIMPGNLFRDALLPIARQQELIGQALAEVDLAPITSIAGIAGQMAEAQRALAGIAEQYQRSAQPVIEALRSFQQVLYFPQSIRFPLEFEYLFGASKGDREAANWLAERVHWEPDGPTIKLLTLHGRIKNKSPQQIWIETLTDAFLVILRDHQTPLVFYIRDSGPIMTAEGAPVTSRMDDLSIPFLYKWAQVEAVRYALNHLTGAPCSIQVILERQPTPSEDEFDLLAWPDRNLSLDSLLGYVRGRPSGSTAIPEDLFRNEYWQAYYQLLGLSTRKRPTQEDVAAAMFISRRTLQKYLERYDLPWPPA
jgi:hypothetical protein